jgi:hypothetical protein
METFLHPHVKLCPSIFTQTWSLVGGQETPNDLGRICGEFMQTPDECPLSWVLGVGFKAPPAQPQAT